MRPIIILSILSLLVPVLPAIAQTPLIGQKEDYTAVKMLQLWEQRTAGKNLAAGKTAIFGPTPSYHLTVKGGTDATDLTDGVLDKRGNQAIWWNPAAVGWSLLEGENKRIIIDLENRECVGKMVWRVVAGSQKRRFTGPKKIKLYGSLDGKNVYCIGERYRWSEDNARPDNYRLPNIGSPDTGEDVYVYPLEIDAQNYEMRFVIIEFEQDSSWFCSDELVILQGSGAGRDLTRLPSEIMQTTDVWIKSPEPVLPLVSGVMLPLWFRQTDFRKNGEKLAVQYRFTLPEGVQLRVPPIYRSQSSGGEVTVNVPQGGNSNKIGPFFFEQTSSHHSPVTVRYQAIGAKADSQPPLMLTLEPKTLPAPFKLNRLTVSIGWMNDSQRLLWRDFERSYGRLGFNAVPAFPRGWQKEVTDAGLDLQQIESNDNPAMLTASGRRIAELRKLGYRIIYMESPLHVVNWRHGKESTEFKCQLSPPPRIDSFCPSYRGKYYAGELKRIRESFLLMGGADDVIWDCELLGSAKWNAPECKRCQAARTASGLDWETFIKAQTIAMLRDMNRQIIEAAQQKQWKTPQIAMFAVDGSHTYAGLLNFPVENLFDFQNPSLYVGNHPFEVHKKIRQCRELSGSNNIIPWLTAATGGQVSPRNVRIMLWEALLNGSRGATYYWMGDFNPAQLYELCRALAEAAPLEDVIVDGAPAHTEFTVKPDTVRHSAVRSGSRAALLLVNPAEAEQSIEWRHHSGQTGQTVLPPGEAQLLDITLKSSATR